MRKTILGLLTLTIFGIPSGASAQVGTDPVVQQLRDSITLLLRERETLRSEQAGTSMPVPTITNVDVTPFEDRAYFRVNLNGPGRIQVTLKSQDSIHRPAPVSSLDFKETHEVSVPGLMANKPYFAEVRVLQHNVAMTPANEFRQGQTPGTATYDPDLRFPTLAAVAPATLTLNGSPRVTYNKVALSVRADRPVLMQARLYPQNAAGLPASREVSSAGSALTPDRAGRPLAAIGPADQTLELTVPEPGKTYYYLVEALDAEGRGSRLNPSVVAVQVPAAPSPFGFEGPLDIRIDPVAGLVLQWNATTPADTGRVTVEQNPTSGSWVLATPSNGNRTLTATIPQSRLSGPEASSTITVWMKSPDGTSRQMQFRMGFQEPNATALAALPKAQRDAINDVYARLRAGAGNIDWRKVANTGLKIFTSIL